MKKLRNAFILLLALLTIFCFSACTTEPICLNHRDTDGDGLCETCGLTAATVAADGDFVFFRDGDINFQFVLASDVSRAVQNRVKGIGDILENFGISLVIAEDTEDTVQECEILVGDVQSRGSTYAFDEHSLGPDGYMIKIVDKKLVITAGSSEKLLFAVEEFINDILQINNETEAINTIFMKPTQNKQVTQTVYDITKVLVNERDIRNYSIATDLGNETYLEVATYIQDTLYTKAGYWLPIVQLGSNTENLIIIVHKDKDATPSDSFRITADESTLYIETEYDNSLSENTKSFIDSYITDKTGEAEIPGGKLVEKDVSTVTYEQFGAMGDGKTNDFLAIKAAHDYANISGQRCSEIQMRPII